MIALSLDNLREFCERYALRFDDYENNYYRFKCNDKVKTLSVTVIIYALLNQVDKDIFNDWLFTKLSEYSFNKDQHFERLKIRHDEYESYKK